MVKKAVIAVPFISILLFGGAVLAQSEAGGDTSSPADPAPANVGSAPEAVAAATTPSPDAQAAAPTESSVAPVTSSVRLKALEQRVNELKERIFRSKARLNLLKETVLHGVIAGSRAIIKHRNDMGSSFRLVKLIYAVDGAQIYSKSDDSGTLNKKREFEVFNGSIVPGDHTVSVQMVYRGNGFGIFSYLKGYEFTLRASHTFTAAEGRQMLLTVKAYERGNVTTEFQDRPGIKFETSLYKVGTAETVADEEAQGGEQPTTGDDAGSEVEAAQ